MVTPKDAGRAAEILSQPSTEELKAETEEAFEGFELPHCPACGGEETLLESVDPVNQWRCDDCGHTWLEESVSSGVSRVDGMKTKDPHEAGLLLWWRTAA